MSKDRYLTAYDEGYAAFERGDAWADNPHIWYTVEGHAWGYGWQDARKIHVTYLKKPEHKDLPNDRG